VFDKNLVSLKKALIIIQSIIKNLGFVLLISSYFYYFKEVNNMCFSHIKEHFLNGYTCGYLSNYLYTSRTKSVPDLALVFNFKRNINLLKEIKAMGVPSTAIVDNTSLESVIEYPIYFNQDSYFINYILLRLYARYIALFKVRDI
jgi:ribosomal protein S2